MNYIICLSLHGWCDTPARTQQLIGRIRNTEILFFAPDQVGSYPSGKRVRPNITVYTLPSYLPSTLSKHPKIQEREQRYLSAFITKKMQKHRFRKPLLWTTSPKHVHLLDHLDYDMLAYDCSEEWDATPPQWEGRLAHEADAVFVASQDLQERLSPCNQNITLLENGVNYPLFFDIPPPSKKTPPTFGWVGNISSDLELAPLVYVARTMPSWQFILIGNVSPRNQYLATLKKLPNVTLQGQCPLSEVPQQLARCHVLLNFQQSRHVGIDIIPIRLYQYLSTGRPIVSMLTPQQIELFPDVIYNAQDNNGFFNLCQSALDEPSDWVVARRQSYGESASWVTRVAKLLETLHLTGFV